MVRKPYRAFVRLVFLAGEHWEDIEGEALWSGAPSPWSLTLSEWCSFIQRWFTRRLDAIENAGGGTEPRKRWREELLRPSSEFALYTWQRRLGRPTVDMVGDWSETMRMIDSAKS